ncbi:VRR-NUC domain-containing protein [Cuneatibacter sp. NSJ-177]|uniref:VRR-NUC domain-containing protein n=1 Tax=Cuneatibacter sp. NSJ-177 TaxID=2931401 RepID=UPI001FD28A5B|nr:VRR-NUC domain-containing protein [Cuneatibacter sp. NSJ-177]
MLEKDLEEWLNQKVKSLGGISRKFVSPGNPGVPDRIYIFPGGKVYFVELKTEVGRFSGIQKWQLKELERLGCRVRRVKGMEQAKALIKELKDEIRTA